MAVKSISIASLTSFSAAAALGASRPSALEVSALTAFSASASMTVSSPRHIEAAPLTSFNARATLTGGSDLDGLTLCDVLDEVLGMWGIFNRCCAPEFAISRAIKDINAAMQLVWNNADGRNYWSSSTLTLTFVADANAQDLPNNIQNVVGPCRLATSRRPLAIIATIGELESFTDLYLEGNAPSEPVAYHIERLKQTGSDPAKTILRVTPAPTAETAFMLEVITEPPRFTANDLTACPIVPIPHTYVETLLLPVARYLASSFYLFRKADQKETIDREYQQARVSLGLADPLPGKSGDNYQPTKEVTQK